MSANAEYSRRWQFRGESAAGNRIAFPVSAFDYGEAKRKVEAKLKPGDKFLSLVLVEKPRFI